MFPEVLVAVAKDAVRGAEAAVAQLGGGLPVKSYLGLLLIGLCRHNYGSLDPGPLK